MYQSKANDVCSSCLRPAWRRHGNHFGWSEEFICGRCLADIVYDRFEVL